MREGRTHSKAWYYKRLVDVDERNAALARRHDPYSRDATAPDLRRMIIPVQDTTSHSSRWGAYGRITRYHTVSWCGTLDRPRLEDPIHIAEGHAVDLYASLSGNGASFRHPYKDATAYHHMFDSERYYGSVMQRGKDRVHYDASETTSEAAYREMLRKREARLKARRGREAQRRDLARDAVLAEDGLRDEGFCSAGLRRADKIAGGRLFTVPVGTLCEDRELCRRLEATFPEEYRRIYRRIRKKGGAA